MTLDIEARNFLPIKD